MTDRELIVAASEYKSSSDSCNSVYMGGMLLARVIRILGGTYGESNLKDLVEKASPYQIAEAKAACKHIIDYMLTHPTHICPCCGSVARGPSHEDRLIRWRRGGVRVRTLDSRKEGVTVNSTRTTTGHVKVRWNGKTTTQRVEASFLYEVIK